MNKRICALALSLAMLLGTAAYAAETPDTRSAVLVDGVIAENLEAVGYQRTSYISLYHATLALRPDAVVAWEEDRMVARGEDFAISALIGANYMVANDRYLYLPDGVKTDETGDTLVPTRALAKALGAEVGWDKEQGMVTLTGGGVPLVNGAEFYNAEDLDLISRVIMHESGNQPLLGKIAVGNVILNRVASPIYPDTVYGVLFERGQFPGATNATPTDECILAAKLAMDGGEAVPGALYFNRTSTRSWASLHRPYLATIAGHAFYG